ncbi:MAG: glycoside hydrolase family 95-like protein, partial [Thermoguttaceae bacterium]
VEGADSAVLLLTAGTNFKTFLDVSGDPGPAVLAQLANSAKKSYATLRDEHIKDHQRLFHRVSLKLPTSASSGLATDQRLAAMRKGEDDPALATLLFQFGRYLIISSSRPGTQPPNLQGIWNGDRNPAWDSKFTTNINLEMNYYPVDVANLGECIEPLLRFCEDLIVTGGWAAKHCFGARGWTLSFNTDLWRGVWPNGGDLSFWSSWPTGGAWLCNRLYDHYRFTGDRRFLERLYPVLKSSAEFFLDTLQEHPTRKYLVTNPSMSPENRHHKIAGQEWAFQPSICAGPTMDNQILREHFDACVTAAKELERDKEFARQVAVARGWLAPTPVGRYGQIQEWLDDWDDPEDRHRHVSQLYGLYPGCEITPDTTPDLVKAVRVTLKHRGLASTGWSTAWKIALLARMRDGETANRILQYLLNYRPIRREDQGEGANSGGVYPNLFSICPPMQIDANFGSCAGIAEMLLQSYAGELHLLPAIPRSWCSGEVKGLCARGGFEVDIAWSNGKLTKAAVHSKLGKPCVVRYGDKHLRFESKPGATYAIACSDMLRLKPDRQMRVIAGWKVHVSTQLLDHEAAVTTRALELLQTQLEGVARDVPQAAVVELQKVPLWISPEYPGVEPHAEYHPNAQWLRDNGRDPAMAKGVEFTNVRIFESECRRMPVFVLHELAHAYHDLVLGNDNAEIKAAYERAKASGKYDRVKRRDAAGHERYDRAYALTNPQEYFAESTEAFFGVNDFFPFTRAELKEHDPEMFSLLQRLWKVNSSATRRQGTRP